MSAPPTATWAQVLAWRLRRQYLAPPAATDATQVARGLAGVQAQVASAAELGIAIRQQAPRPGAVGRALWQERTLVKTWAMRGTLHLLAADEAGSYLSVVGAVRGWERPSWQKAFGAGPGDLEAIAEAARTALADGGTLTREELIHAIVARTGSHHLAEALGSGWGALLKPLAWWGVLCYGPPRGNRVSFAMPEAWLPGWQGVPAPDDAAPLVIRRFLSAHGPATPEHVNAWLTRGALRRSDVRRWFDALAGDLAAVDVEGSRLLLLEADLEELRAQVPSGEVCLLPGFDQYVLAAGTGAAYLIPPAHRAEVSRAAGWISPVVVYRGRVVGTWTSNGGAITPALFDEVPRARLEEAMARISPLISRSAVEPAEVR